MGGRQVQIGVALPVVADFTAVFPGQQPPLTVFIDVDGNPVIGRATLATEHQWEQRLVRFARLRALLDQRKIATRLRFQRGPHGIATGKELMQAEGKDRESTGRGTPELRTLG